MITQLERDTFPASLTMTNHQFDMRYEETCCRGALHEDRCKAYEERIRHI